MIVIDHPAWEALRVGIANAITNNLPEWLIFGSALSYRLRLHITELIPEICAGLVELVQERSSRPRVPAAIAQGMRLR